MWPSTGRERGHELRRACRARLVGAERDRQPTERLGRARLHQPHRVREDHRVRGRVGHPGDADGGLGDDVVHPVARDAHRVAGEEGAERQLGAVRVVRGESARDQLRCAQRREVCNGVAELDVERLDRVRERVHRARRERRHRLRGHQLGRRDDQRGSNGGAQLDAGRGAVKRRHLGAREGGGDRRARQPVGGRHGLRGVDDAPTPEPDDREPADALDHGRGGVRHAAAWHLEDRPGAPDQLRRLLERLLRRQQREGVEAPFREQSRSVGERAGPVAHEALAVDPGVVGLDRDRASVMAAQASGG